MKLLIPCFLACLLGGCAFDTVSLSVGYGKASVAGTVHLREDYKK